MITGTIFFAFLVAACSDTGPVRYADDEFWWVNYGIPTPEPTEAPGEVTEEETSEGSTSETTEADEPEEDFTEATDAEASDEKPSEPEEQEDPELQKQLMAVWKSEPVNVEDTVLQSMESAGKYKPYLRFDKTKLVVNVRFTYREDHTAVMELDPKSYQDLMNYVTQEVTTAVIKYYESYLQSVGLNLSVEKYLNLLGISLKDYVADEIKKSSGSLNVNDYRRERFCEVRDGMLFIAEKAEQLEKSRDYAKIELAGEQLTFRQFYEAGKPVEKPMGLDVTMPLSFQRQP